MLESGVLYSVAVRVRREWPPALGVRSFRLRATNKTVGLLPLRLEPVCKDKLIAKNS
jgi:hypothetical protein